MSFAKRLRDPWRLPQEILTTSQFYRIPPNITHAAPKMLRTADETVEVILLPKRAALSRATVDLAGGETLPRVQQFRECRSGAQREQRVNMIRHHDPCRLRAEFSFVELQHAANDSCQRRLAQQTRAVALIQPSLQTASILVPILVLGGLILWPRMAIQPCVQCFLKRLRQFSRYGIRRAEGDEIRAAVLLPVRQAAGRAPLFSRRLEWLQEHRGAAWLPSAVSRSRLQPPFC